MLLWFDRSTAGCCSGDIGASVDARQPLELLSILVRQNRNCPGIARACETSCTYRRRNGTKRGCGSFFRSLLDLGEVAWPNTTRYVILDQAKRYLADSILGPRLRKVIRLLIAQQGKTAFQILGSPDDLKLRSCLTLFREAAVGDSDRDLFDNALDQFYGGEPDVGTLELLRSK